MIQLANDQLRLWKVETRAAGDRTVDTSGLAHAVYVATTGSDLKDVEKALGRSVALAEVVYLGDVKITRSVLGRKKVVGDGLP